MQRSNTSVMWVQEEEESKDGAEARLGEVADWEFSRKDKVHQPIHTFPVWAVIFKWGQLPPRERSVISGDIVVVSAGVGSVSAARGEARDAAKHPAVCRTVPTTRNDLARMSEMLRLRNPAWASASAVPLTKNALLPAFHSFSFPSFGNPLGSHQLRDALPHTLHPKPTFQVPSSGSWGTPVLHRPAADTLLRSLSIYPASRKVPGT